MIIDHWFRGPHRSGNIFAKEGVNRELARARIGRTVTVSCERLLLAIGSDGVDADKARVAVEHILDDAEREAVGKTLGINDATVSQDQ